MKSIYFRTARSSFWRWVFFNSILYLVCVVCLFLFVLVKPFTKTIGQIIGTAIGAAALVHSQSPQHGLVDLQLVTSNFPDIKFDTTDVPLSKIPGPYLGLVFIEHSLEQLIGDAIQIGYEPPPNQALLVKAQKYPQLTLRISIRSFWYASMFAGSVFLLVAFTSVGSAFWISRKLTAPLQELAHEAMLLASDREFKAIRLRPDASKEVTQLANCLNKMRTSLDNSIKEREFLLSSVAHDLRTPLSRMRLAIELDGEKNDPYTDELRDDLDEISLIMEHFIELSRLSLEVEEPWVVSNINTLLLGIQQKYSRAGIILSMALDENMPIIKHKPIALTRLLYNLIDNAYRHGTGEVVIETLRTGSHVVLSVSNPMGVHENSLTQTFLPHSSGKTAGLGLLIIRRFSEVHGANLQESSLEGIRKYALTFAL